MNVVQIFKMSEKITIDFRKITNSEIPLKKVATVILILVSLRFFEQPLKLAMGHNFKTFEKVLKNSWACFEPATK